MRHEREIRFGRKPKRLQGERASATGDVRLDARVSVRECEREDVRRTSREWRAATVDELGKTREVG